MSPALIKLCAAALALLMLVGAFFGYGHYQYVKGGDVVQGRFDQYKATADGQAKQAKADALAKTSELEQQVKDAQNAARIKQAENDKLRAQIATVAAAASAESSRLRDNVSALQRELSTAPQDTVRRYADAAGDALSECAARYSEMESKFNRCTADTAQCANAVEALKQAWPK